MVFVQPKLNNVRKDNSLKTASVRQYSAQTVNKRLIVFVRVRLNNVQKDNSFKMAFVLKSAQVPSQLMVCANQFVPRVLSL